MQYMKYFFECFDVVSFLNFRTNNIHGTPNLKQYYIYESLG
jgi:hypothetical protein